MIKNRLLETLGSTNDSNDLTGEFAAFLIGNKIALYLIQYNYIRCGMLHIKEGIISFMSEGNNFVIQGKNMLHLMHMIRGRMISRIIEGDSMKIGGEDVTITSVIVSPVNSEEQE